MKQTLQLKLSQHLTLTPQLQQSIRLLQLSTVELNAEVERMLQENPLLEKAEGEEEPLPTASQLASAAASSTEEMPAHDDDRAGGKEAGDEARERTGNRRSHRFRGLFRRRFGLGRRQLVVGRRRRRLLPAAGGDELAARSPPVAARRAQPAAARPPARRRADRRSGRGRLSPHLARGSGGDVSGGARDRPGRAFDRALLPAELRAGGDRRPRRFRMPRAAVEGAAGIDSLSRRGARPSSPSTWRFSRRAISPS